MSVPIVSWSLEKIGTWVVDRCLEFGAQPETAYRVAATFVAAIRLHRDSNHNQ